MKLPMLGLLVNVSRELALGCAVSWLVSFVLCPFCIDVQEDEKSGLGLSFFIPRDH